MLVNMFFVCAGITVALRQVDQNDWWLGAGKRQPFFGRIRSKTNGKQREKLGRDLRYGGRPRAEEEKEEVGGVAVNAGHWALAGGQAAKPWQLVILCVTDLIDHKPHSLPPSLLVSFLPVSPSHYSFTKRHLLPAASGGSHEAQSG